MTARGEVAPPVAVATACDPPATPLRTANAHRAKTTFPAHTLTFIARIPRRMPRRQAFVARGGSLSHIVAQQPWDLPPRPVISDRPGRRTNSADDAQIQITVAIAELLHSERDHPQNW